MDRSGGRGLLGGGLGLADRLGAEHRAGGVDERLGELVLEVEQLLRERELRLDQVGGGGQLVGVRARRPVRGEDAS